MGEVEAESGMDSGVASHDALAQQQAAGGRPSAPFRKLRRGREQPRKLEELEDANLQHYVSNVKLNQSQAPETSLRPSAANLNLSLIPQPCTDAICFADPRPGCSGRDVGVIAFYFPGHDEPWDALCGSSFLGNIWDLRPTGGMELEAPCRPGVRHSFKNAEAA